MTIQPNDRKHEQTPEFQDEAQQRADRTPGRTGGRRTGTAAQKDAAGKEDAAGKDAVTEKDAAAHQDAAAQKDTPVQNHAEVHRDSAGQRDTGRDTGARKDDAAARDAGPVDSVANHDRAKVDNRSNDGARHAPDSLKPGTAENQAPVASRTRLFEEQEVSRFREQWRELQAGFVDEPRSAVREADTLVTQMMDSLTSQLAAQKRALQGESDAGDTEQLRVALQRYRSLFDQMLQV